MTAKSKGEAQGDSVTWTERKLGALRRRAEKAKERERQAAADKAQPPR